MRIRVQSYGPSESATELARYLGTLKLKHHNSKFKGKPSDIIINWGNVKKVHTSKYLNPLQSVRDATNKLTTFTKLQSASIPIPPFFTSHSDLDPDTIYLARTTITGHSGEGIVVGTPSDLPHAPLYTQFIPKIAEYRVIVVNNEAVDIKRKLKKRDFEGDRSPHVWNCDNGYIFARNDITFPDSLPQIGISAVNALNLSYAAVDIIEDADHNLYVLEINSAFGLSGTTTQLVGDAIKRMLPCT
jgi:glutathione synthase/RimK-type ligase-like ATP-grasp enzyme